MLKMRQGDLDLTVFRGYTHESRKQFAEEHSELLPACTLFEVKVWTGVYQRGEEIW